MPKGVSDEGKRGRFTATPIRRSRLSVTSIENDEVRKATYVRCRRIIDNWSTAKWSIRPCSTQSSCEHLTRSNTTRYSGRSTVSSTSLRQIADDGHPRGSRNTNAGRIVAGDADGRRPATSRRGVSTGAGSISRSRATVCGVDYSGLGRRFDWVVAGRFRIRRRRVLVDIEHYVLEAICVTDGGRVRPPCQTIGRRRIVFPIRITRRSLERVGFDRRVSAAYQ